MNRLSVLKQKIEALPQVGLAHLPTPLEHMARLSKRLGKVNVFLKRDDQTGLAFGGNKARKLDFIMADVLAQGADTVVTWAGVQSNWCRQTAAAAKKLGLEPILVLFKRPGLPYDYDGNLLLDFVFDSAIRLVESEPGQKMMEYGGVKRIIDRIADEERAKGRRPYIAPIGGSLPEASMSRPWGAMGYVKAFAEMAEQAESRNVSIDAVVFATGSGATHAGLLVGAKLVSPGTRIIGVSVSETRKTMTGYVRTIAESSLALLGESSIVHEEEIIALEDYLKEGYGVLNRDVAEAIRMVAETEGVLLDPVYTGKAMAGFLDLVEKDYFGEGANVVFLHSGGTPALFPYRDKLLSFLKG